MKRSFFLPLLILALTVHSQKRDILSKKGKAPASIDSIAVKLQRMKDSMDKTQQDLQWQNNMRNIEDVMKQVDSRRKKEKSKAVIYIVIGVGMLIVLIIGLRRRRAEKRS